MTHHASRATCSGIARRAPRRSCTGCSRLFRSARHARALLTDNGQSMQAHEVEEGLERPGIVHPTTLPYRPEQNGKQESFWGPRRGALDAHARRQARADARLSEPGDAGVGRTRVPPRGAQRARHDAARAHAARPIREPAIVVQRQAAPGLPHGSATHTTAQ
ncbi:MAG: DDE-type integrase/transposase/recombinase [Sandaracinaceae bacterium]|nr:DDE-type integrase/transposase/recombinase [Sandaracinaceae bacterium]